MIHTHKWWKLTTHNHFFFLFVAVVVGVVDFLLLILFLFFFLSTLLFRASRIASFAFICLSSCSLAIASMALLKPPKLRRPNTHCGFDIVFFSRKDASCSFSAFCFRARSYCSGFSYVQCSSFVVVVVVVLAVVVVVVVVSFSAFPVFFSCARCMNFKPFSLELNLLLLPPAVVAVVAVAPVMVTRNANDAWVLRYARNIYLMKNCARG